MGKAMSLANLLKKTYNCFEFSAPWKEAFGSPQKTGVWFIWGHSGNGKTALTMQLCMELSRHGRLAYNSREEGGDKTLQDAFIRAGFESFTGPNKPIILDEPMSELSERLLKRRSPDFVVIDSFQYAGLSYAEYKRYKELHRNKLLIFISHADGKNPMGRAATSVMYDASLKIWVEGMRATSKGRYIGSNGGFYDIWPEESAKYHGQSNSI
ncbi:MAG TPA: ATP-dependent serine protease [Bacteroidetes bacterium]|nr:ATP-dependent serine protease [Bacteroidota bacterium]